MRLLLKISGGTFYQIQTDTYIYIYIYIYIGNRKKTTLSSREL